MAAKRPGLTQALGTDMKIIAGAVLAIASTVEPSVPLASGDYTFQHHFAEQPTLPSFTLTARIRGNHIVLVNPKATDAFPAGVIAEGTLMWHAATQQWIIGGLAADRLAKDVGGCSNGPEVIDLKSKVYWTC